MKLVRTGALVLLFCALNWVLGFAAPPPGKEWSAKGQYQYNESLSEKYNADIYGNEHGKFTEMEGGSFTQNGKKGEYQYLGYTYEEWEFTNDNWFGKSGSKGNVFDSGYTDIKWLESDEAPDSWGKVEEHPMCDQLTEYIITAKFYDADHVTEGKTSTGLCLQELLGSDINYVKRIAVLLNAPTKGQFGYIRLRYEKNGKQDYTTVIIKPFPYIECNMTATAEPISIPMGETRDVTVRIDTGDSFWCLEGEKYYTFTKREFWAGTGEVREIEKVESTNAVIEFTVKDVKPGTTINVWSKVYSEELKALDYDYEAEAVTSIYIYETFPPQPDAYDLDYNILSRTVRYPLSDTELTATLKLPGESWYGNATGLLDVVNNTPDLLRNFMVENNPYVNEASSVIVRNPIIKTTFYRKDFGDDPEGRKWGNVPNPMVPLERYGSVSYHGSVERDYRYEYSCGGCQENPETNERYCPGGHIGVGTATAYFPSGTNGKTVRVFVYNGMPEVPKKRFTSSISGNIDTSPIKNLYWESEPYPLNVIRWMYHMDAYGNLYGGVPVDGRFQRTFTQQCSARIEYDVAKSMEAHYERSREAARQRNYNQSAYDKAVFATDVDLRNVDYPIKSGYYFNPCGEYEFVVETVTYKTTPDDTREHKELVNSVINSFRYETDLMYINSNKVAVNLQNEPLTFRNNRYERKPAALTAQDPTGVDGITLLKVLDRSASASRYSKVVEELYHSESEYGNTHPYLKAILEGYPESGTNESHVLYKYREYVKDGQKIYKITERTRVTIVINPDNRKLYTHAHMPDGTYYVKAWLGDIDLSRLSGEYRKLGILEGYKELDSIEVTVRGSLYDDIY